MTSVAQTGPGPNPKRELQKRIVVSAELEEIMKRVSDLKNVAGMVVVNSEGLDPFKTLRRVSIYLNG